MKKIFTLLFCVTAMAMAANAHEFANVDQCINTLLNRGDNTTMMTTSQQLDANHDGVLNIHDVTCMINEILADSEQGMNRAPKQKQDIDKLIEQALKTTDKPDINTVTDAINEQQVND